MILTLSHGQAALERSVSINKSIVEVNMTEESIVARKTIKDHMLSNDIQPDMIEIPNKMINFYRSARQKYEIHKERERGREEKEKGQMDTATDIGGGDKRYYREVKPAFRDRKNAR